MMSVTEAMNKGSIYMGAYDKAMSLSKLVVDSAKQSVKLKRITTWLEARNINPLAKDLEEQVHRYAKNATIKTQFDLSKGGQMFVQSNPYLGVLFKLGGFTVKTGEYMAHNAKQTAVMFGKAMTNPGKYMDSFLYQPETMATLRGALAIAGITAVGKAADIDVSKVVGIKNFVLSSFPVVNVGTNVWRGVEAMLYGEPGAALKMSKGVSYATGIPAAMVWKVARYVDVADKNRGRAGEDWVIYDRKGKAITQMSALEFAQTVFMPVAPNNEQEYYDFLRDKAINSRKARAISDTLTVMQGRMDLEERMKKKQQLRELRRENKKMTKDYKRENPEYGKRYKPQYGY